MAPREILDGWKAISDYLQRDRRTCQRWERDLALPVHRLDGSPRARVFAYTDEVDAWLAKEPWVRSSPLRRLLDFVRSKPRAAAAALLVVLVLAFLLPKVCPGPPEAASHLTIAVLPFQNASARPDSLECATTLPLSLVQRLAGSHYYQVLPYDKITGALQKLGIEPGAPYSAEDIRRIGEMTGASHAVSGVLIEDKDRSVFMMTTRGIGSDEATPSRFPCGDAASTLDVASQMADEVKRDLGLSRSAQSSDFDAPAVPITTSSLKAFRLYNEGRRFHIRADYARSAELMRKAIRCDPEFAMAWRSLGASLRSFGDPVGAEDCYRKALDLRSNATMQEQYFIRTTYFQSRAQYAISLQVLRDWRALYPDDTQALLLTGRAWLFEEKAEVAREALLEALRKGDQNPFTFYYAALACSAAGRPDEAEATIERGSSLHPGNRLIAAAGATVAAFQGRYDQALRLLDEIKTKNSGPTIELRYGDILLLKDDFRGAKRHYSAIRPASARFKARLAALALAEGRYGQATDLARASGNHALLAYIEWRRGNLSAGREEAEQALKDWDRSAQTYSELVAFQMKGGIEVSLGDIGAAKATEAEIRERGRSGFGKGYLRAASYLRGLIASSEGRTEEAAEEFASAIGTSPGSLPYHEDGPYPFEVPTGTRALIFAASAHNEEKAGDLSGALDLYLKLIDLHGGRLQHPDLYALAHYQVGRILQTQGDLQGAKKSYSKFLELWKNADPGLPEVEDAKARLSALD
jgi:tetratricopeptide (TPR) repeat protein/TolB-like protein